MGNHSRDIMPTLAERGNRITRKDLVGQNAHRSGRYYRVDLLCLQRSAGVAQAGLDILTC
jgi:hypothetical protein